ncbi:MAG TPA: hypothetical protein VH741_10270 [Candidatus Limnocylindrales bacterium]
MLRRARREPATLAIAIEPVAAALREASARAARKPARGGAANALFLSGTAEELPWLLAGRVDETIVALPWGALLRGVLDAGSDLARGIRACLAPTGALTLLLSVEERDASAGEAPLDAQRVTELARAYEALGWECAVLRPAGAADVAELSGGWGQRLGIPARRPAFVLSLRSGPAAARGYMDRAGGLVRPGHARAG